MKYIPRILHNLKVYPEIFAQQRFQDKCSRLVFTKILGLTLYLINKLLGLVLRNPVIERMDIGYRFEIPLVEKWVRERAVKQ